MGKNKYVGLFITPPFQLDEQNSRKVIDSRTGQVIYEAPQPIQAQIVVGQRNREWLAQLLMHRGADGYTCQELIDMVEEAIACALESE